MSNAVIKVSDLSKRYRIGTFQKKSDTLSGKLLQLLKSPVTNFKQLRSMNRFDSSDVNVHWALKDINFEVNRGEVLGIIGHNGAGKSTLLKILSRITPPSTGEIELIGRVSSLLEVGTGFHPELTGRDNIYMNGTIHGMRKREIDEKLDEIVSFSGIEKYIDTPVKFYSSGMKVRLGFAVAAHLEPEILIIDEVLAVGDMEFQKKCLGKMKDVAKEGRTVLFVSHDMGAILNLCPETIILNAGKIFDRDESEKAIIKYISALSEEASGKRTPHTNVELVSVAVQDKVIKGKCLIENDKLISIEVELKTKLPDMDITFGFDIFNGLGTKLIHLRSDAYGVFGLKTGINKLYVELNNIPFLSGSYHVTGWIAEYKGKRLWEYADICVFDVLPTNLFNDQQSHLKNALLSPDARFKTS